MEISDHDVDFAWRQIGRQLTDLRNCGDREGVDVLGPRCLGFISALAMVGVITQHEYRAGRRRPMTPYHGLLLLTAIWIVWIIAEWWGRNWKG